MRHIRIIGAPWREPRAVIAPFAGEPFALLLSSGGAGARWSYLARAPDRTVILRTGEGGRDLAELAALLGSPAGRAADGPPFQGGVAALLSYEMGDRFEPVGLPRDPDWPDLVLARYPAILAFDHGDRRVLAIGRGDDEAAATQAAQAALAWLDRAVTRDAADPDPPAACFATEGPDAAETYEAAVRDVVARIGAGEIFQANIARVWRGRLRPGATPFDVFRRLEAAGPAPYAAYWRLPGLALVSNSPEQFLAVAADGRTVTSRPIKGTRPRRPCPRADREEGLALLASGKDRAENLMIVDLMRNDLSRVCEPGSVRAEDLFTLESFETVHHLVSGVTGRLAAGRTVADLLAAAFPPGSITGAPKTQAMRVIAAHEPPRGPWCGSLAWIGCDGAMSASVLIRTAAFVEDAKGWRFRAPAGAGITADSDPRAERLETEAKILALRRALAGAP